MQKYVNIVEALLIFYPPNTSQSNWQYMVVLQQNAVSLTQVMNFHVSSRHSRDEVLK